jgi:cytochrome o ubiquinol oxidase subunit 3
MTRRLHHIADPTWRPMLLAAGLGAVVIFCGILCRIAQLYVSGPAPTRIVVVYGFWIFILSDIVMCSALFAAYGTHVATGLIWLLYMSAEVAVKGLRPTVLRRLLCFSLFWHALDIVWVGVMTLVYLVGVQR